MRRWNGWGDEEIAYPLPESAALHLATQLGPGTPPTDATLEAAAGAVPASRLPAHPLISTDPIDRLRHARGQSLPDWVALRTGRIGVFPDGVAFPSTSDEVQSLLGLAGRIGFHVIPYGGGTSVVGHINPLPGEVPVLTMDLSRMADLLEISEVDGTATFEAGVPGPEIERLLGARGYTLGHFPQSFELSTLGGWIATRSSGQQSYRYGRIEDLFVGGRLETPQGTLELPTLPASAAGPDLRHLVLGSEGRLGVITQAVIRIRPQPQTEAFRAVFFLDWETGAAAVRTIAQDRIQVSMLRLSDARETETTLILSGKERLVEWADRGLRGLGYGNARSLLIYGTTGTPAEVRLARRRAEAVARRHGGLAVGSLIGRLWRKSRFLTPYLRNTLWERGYAIDTLETALPWSAVHPAAEAVLHALGDGLSPRQERVLAFAHLSHVYRDGASLYVTYLFRRAADPDETLDRWQTLKAAASAAILRHGGTISHQHGVGLDHAPYLASEKGPLGVRLLQTACRTLDPEGRMNPGKLLPEG